MITRTNSLNFDYLMIAKKAHEKLLELDDQIATTDHPNDLRQLHTQRTRESITCIIFSALFLEAFIYDFGARYRGDGFIKKYVDKLTLVAKWIVIPELVTGKKVSRGNHAIALIRCLQTHRNSLVHQKSSPPPTTHDGSTDWEKILDSDDYVEGWPNRARELWPAVSEGLKMLKSICLDDGFVDGLLINI